MDIDIDTDVMGILHTYIHTLIHTFIHINIHMHTHTLSLSHTHRQHRKRWWGGVSEHELYV